MGIMTGNTTAVAANTVTTNQLAGLPDEFVLRPSRIRLRAVTSAAGLNCTLLIGGVAAINDQPITSVKANTPILPDDVMGIFGAPAPSRLILTFRNTTGGALNVSFVVEVDPVA